MPKFLYWCAPLTLMFITSIFMKLSQSIIIFCFFMVYMGLFVELVRGIVIAKQTPKNKGNKERHL